MTGLEIIVIQNCKNCSTEDVLEMIKRDVARDAKKATKDNETIEKIKIAKEEMVYSAGVHIASWLETHDKNDLNCAHQLISNALGLYNK